MLGPLFFFQKGALVKLCVIVPTVGRPSLKRTLDSLRPQLRPEDLAIVACDVTGVKAREVALMSEGFMVINVGSQTPWGHNACNTVLDRLPAEVTHTWRLDDDDVAPPHALRWLRRAACGLPVFARMALSPTLLVWTAAELSQGNIGSPCILAPRSEARWGARYEGDFDYAFALFREHRECLWLDRVVAEIGG
jgi:hypothetical protein